MIEQLGKHVKEQIRGGGPGRLSKRYKLRGSKRMAWWVGGRQEDPGKACSKARDVEAEPRCASRREGEGAVVNSRDWRKEE